VKKFLRILKKILILTSILSGVVLFVVVLSSAAEKKKSLTVKSLAVHVDYESGINFIDDKGITEQLNSLSGGSLFGRKIEAVDWRTLEHILLRNPYIEDAQLFTDQQQIVHVQLVQKRPIIRVINSNGVSYYISENNERMPLCDKFTPNVPIVLGQVETLNNPQRDSLVQQSVFQFFSVVNQDSFLRALVDQVVVLENGECNVIPRTGYHIIRFGKPNANTKEKFERLKIFYKEGLSKTGWEAYKTINLKFDNQVVCEKRDTI
jgi:cell division protein FtsQ